MSISGLSTTPSSAGPGETVELRADVANAGDASGTFDIEFTSAGEVIDTQSVTLDGGESEHLATELTFDEPGRYDVGVNGSTTSVVVIEEPSEVSGENGTSGNETGENGGETDTQGPPATMVSPGSASSLRSLLSWRRCHRVGAANRVILSATTAYPPFYDPIPGTSRN
ncbi:CARDB domain-containing protein [Natronoarchaeum sp. GCM10025703]|uniref:CARDB domain-containing protein n=1 Tax=Natronoarchaeum sp. GCM10025703 TaxID=3252685 RepID=UPI003611A001